MNKHGWGLRAELGFLLLFLVCILISTVGLHKFGLLINQAPNDDGFGSSSSINYDFDGLERKVVVAAKNYYNDRYPAGTSDTIVVSVDTLKTKAKKKKPSTFGVSVEVSVVEGQLSRSPERASMGSWAPAGF